MKITKIDGVSHYKEKEKGVLKGKDILNGKIEKIVKKRYDATIESKIYKEFIKLRKNRIEQNNEKSILKLIKLNIDKNEKEIKTLLLNKFKIKEKNKKYDKYMLDENKLDNDIKIYESVESLYFLIKEIYLGQNNKKWNISKIDLEKIMEEDNNLIMLGYKLKKNITENDYPYLYSDKNGQESTSVYKLLKKLIEENKDRNQDIRKSQEYEKIRKNFEEYKNRKINLLVKSIKNNKINIQYINNEIKSHNNSREENIIKFFKKMIEEKNKPILKDKLELFRLEVFFDEEFLEEIKKLLDSDDLDKSDNKKISELRGKIFSRIREKIKENRDRNILENIYFLELKKYIENNLSHKKENNKNNNNTGEEKSKELYLKFLKKVLFIDDNNRISIEKLKSRIDDNFKNLLIQHVIEYGKIKYYVENDDYIRNIVKNGELKLETKDLEYIKTKETLIRKMAVLVSFAANSYYNLFGSVSEDILGTEVVKNRRTNVIKVKSYIFKEKMLNYFFDSEDFDVNKTIEVLESISYSIYNIRNGVGHFNKLVLGKYKKKDINTNKRVEEDLNNNEEIKGYFIKKRGEIEKKIKERFLSNNLQYYYAKEKIENSVKNIKVLNLFAYTGCATCNASKAGAKEVVHVDASKGMTQIAKENAKLCGIENNFIRYIVDDVFKFIEKEIRRGRKYDAVIMDPPSYGRGTNGEIWKLEDSLIKLLSLINQVLVEKPLFLIVSSYTTGISSISLKNVINTSSLRKKFENINTGELSLPIKGSDLLLPCGIYARCDNC